MNGKNTAIALNKAIFSTYILPHFLYFAPIAGMQDQIFNKLQEMYNKFIKKALGLKKNSLYDNIHQKTLILPLEYYKDFLLFSNLFLIFEKTPENQENAIL